MSNQIGPAVAFLQLCKEIAPNMVFSNADDRVEWMDRLGTLEFHIAKFQFGDHLSALGTKFHIFQDLAKLAKDGWRGPAKAGVRALPFVRNKELREIAERDLASFESMAKSEETKSAIVLAGSVIEAILFDLAEKDPTATLTSAKKVKAKHAPSSPRWASFEPANDSRWTLEQVIVVCGPDGLDVLGARSAKLADVTRDYRNFVHPRVERTQILDNAPLTPPDSTQAGALMELVIDQVRRWHAAHP